MCDDIKTHVINDCIWWHVDYIRASFPEWIKDQYVDLAKAKHEKQRLKIGENLCAGARISL
jgi:hypothetical protein